MEMKLLTVLLVCLSVKYVMTSQNVAGRCCGVISKGSNGGGGGGGCPGTAEGKFHPPTINTDEAKQEENNIFWKTQDLHCPSTHNIVYYDMKNDTDNIMVLSQGELMFEFVPQGNDILKQTTEYCVEVHDEGYRAAVCRPDPDKICGSAVCVPKCCDHGQVMQDFTCRRGAGNMSLQFYSMQGQLVSAPSSMKWVGGMLPDCGDLVPTASYDNTHKHLLVNGKLLERDFGVIHERNHYCIDDMYIDGTHSQLYLMCLEPESTAMNVKHHLQKVGYVVTIIFLMITTLFHIFIPSLQDAQGLCLVSHMISLGVTYIVLFYLSLDQYNMSHGFCIFSGFVFHYSYLAMFFWLNIMCFDIWRVIRETTKGIPLIGILSNDRKKFRLWSLYGWGCPLVLTVVAAVMHTLPEEHAKNIIAPGFGRETCWITGDLELLVYCYAYVATLFVLDLIFFGHTIYMLLQAGNAFTCFSKEVSVTVFNRKHLDAFWLRFSLFILMVLCWTTNILSWKIPPQEMWILTDFINSAQGFLVFVIFLSSKKRRDLVRELLQKVPLPCFRPQETTDPRTAVGIKMSSLHSPSRSSSGPSTGDTEISHDQHSNTKEDK